MDIKQDIENFLSASGWTPYKLSKASGVNLNVIRRIQLGTRNGVHSSTLAKLAPYLYGPAGCVSKADGADNSTKT